MTNSSIRPEYIKHKFANVINISKIVTMHYFEFGKNYIFPGETHDFWELVYVDSGKVLITAGKNTYTLKQREMIFHKPNEFHAISSDKDTPSNVFIISFVSSSKNMEFFKNKKIDLPVKLSHYLNTLIEEGKKTFDLPFNNPNLLELTPCINAPFGGQQVIRTTLEQLLIMLIRMEGDFKKNPDLFPDKKSLDNHLVNSVINLLNDNIYGKITVDEICRKLNYSKTYISKIFSRHCGQTIIEYYTKLKIKEAKMLLRKNLYTVEEVAYMLGFNDAHYFSRVFKKATNMPPRQYVHSISK